MAWPHKVDISLIGLCIPNSHVFLPCFDKLAAYSVGSCWLLLQQLLKMASVLLMLQQFLEQDWNGFMKSFCVCVRMFALHQSLVAVVSVKNNMYINGLAMHNFCFVLCFRCRAHAVWLVLWWGHYLRGEFLWMGAPRWIPRWHGWERSGENECEGLFWVAKIQRWGRRPHKLTSEPN